MIKSIISLIRPLQWIKNMFVLLPMFFGGQLLNVWCWRQAMITFFSFSFIASAIYCINDLKDIESDRLHPLKRNRPLASGSLKPVTAITVSLILLFLSFLVCYEFMTYRVWEVMLILIIYFILNIAYCLKLKQIAIIDVFIVSLGFVLRLIAGGVSCNIWLSPWIICLTFLISLFLAFAKRRDDVMLHEASGIVARKNILRYNSIFLNQTLGILASVTLVCYIMFSVSPDVEIRLGSNYIYITSIFVLAGILRYLQLTIVDSKSGSPTKILFKDRFIQICILLWVSLFIIIIYL